MIDALPLLIDTHVHLDASPLKERLEEEVRRARQAGIGHFVIPGVRREGWRQILEIARAVEGAWAAPGLHPQAAGEWGPDGERELQQFLYDPKVAAVGEIGLDALLPSPPLDLQEKVFRAQLRLAVAAGRPVLIHCRKATERLLQILREEKAERVGGIFHGFSGSLETALAGVRLGFAVGVGGIVTYPNARRLPEIVQKLPPEWLVLETDAPDLAPHPHRGGDNRPAWLTLVAAKVAELRGCSLEETARVTTENARRILMIG